MACAACVRTAVVLLLSALLSAALASAAGPLQEAIEAGNVEDLKAALAAEAAPVAIEGEAGANALRLALEQLPERNEFWRGYEWPLRTEIIRLLLGAGVDVRAADDPVLLSAINASQDARMVEIVGLLLDAGADISAMGRHGQTPLTYALGRGCNDVAKLLVSRGAPVNERNGDGDTPLHVAAGPPGIPPDGEVVFSLIRAGADISAEDDFGLTPLLRAARAGDADTVRTLLVLGADSTATSKDGWTALMFAAASNDPHWWGVWLNEQSKKRAEARGEPFRPVSGIYSVMISQRGDLMCPSGKVWTLLRHSKVDLNATDSAGRTIDDLIAKRTDPEAMLMRCMLEVARRENVRRSPWEEATLRKDFPRPEGLPEPPQPDRPAR